MSLLGFKAPQDLGIIKVVLAVNSNSTCELDTLIREHPKVFSGLGCLDKPYKIKIDYSVTPVINPPRKILRHYAKEGKKR